MTKTELSPEMIGRSPLFTGTLRRVESAARVQRTTLLVGPTGSGKDVLARRLHACSPRRALPFVPVHCGAMPEALVESELFGHHRGAFTGAQSARAGLVRSAAEGTLFLDEVDSLSPVVQSKLLRLLDSGEYRAVGADKSERSGAWILAATNRDLEERVRAGAFREDLFYRLAAVRIEVPPLCARGDDVILLAEHFLRGASPVARFTADALSALRTYRWPGNVRELRHRIEAALLDEPEALTAEALGLATRSPSVPEPAPEDRGLDAALWGLVTRDRLSFAEAISKCEQTLIQAALGAHQNNRTRAARALGIHLRTIYKKLDAQESRSMPDRARSRGHEGSS